MRIATVEKEWAEVRRPGRGKVEDWSWTVTYLYHGMVADRHYIKTEADAKLCAALYEAGEFCWTDYDGVAFESTFQDVSGFELELEEMFEGEVDASTLVFEVIE